MATLRTPRLCLFLPALIVMTALASASQKKERRPKLLVEMAEPVVEVPLDHADGHAGIEVMIGEKGPFEFHFDTYASIYATIDQKLVKQLELPIIGKMPNSDGTKVVLRDVAWIEELSFGGITLRNVRALVDDYGFVPTKKGTLQGLVGFPALSSKLVTFDYPQHRLVVSEQALAPTAPGTMPFVLKTGSPDITLDIGGEPVVIGIDTGSTTGLFLDMRIAERLGITEELVKSGQAQTAYTTHDLMRGVLPHPLEIAGFDIQPPLAKFFALPQERGLLGYEILRSFAVSFDGPNKLVRFVRPPLPEAVELTGEELDAWVGRYDGEKATFHLERKGDELLFREDSLPSLETLPLSAKELLLTSAPIHLFLESNEQGVPSLRVQSHRDRPATIAVRKD